MRRTDVEYLEYLWPMRHFLITCGDIRKRANIIAVSFCMPVSKTPPLLACAIGHNAYSCELLEDSGEFVVNVPPSNLKREIYYCGFHSGRQIDKFQETGLHAQAARQVKAPIITECAAFMECRVTARYDSGDKRLFIGEVIEAYADSAVVSGQNPFAYASGDFPRKIYGTRFPEPEDPE